jgi:hypothetical protein
MNNPLRSHSNGTRDKESKLHLTNAPERALVTIINVLMTFIVTTDNQQDP